MNNTANMKNLIIVGVVVIVVGISLIMYINREPYVEDPLISGVYSSDTSGSIDGSFISALNSLKGLRLDVSVFSHPAWVVLNDFGQVLTPQPDGRLNPFAPVSAADAAAVQ